MPLIFIYGLLLYFPSVATVQITWLYLFYHIFELFIQDKISFFVLMDF